MKQFSGFGFIFTFIYLFGFKESYAESISECKNVVCPELQSSFECPFDSRPIIYDPAITNTNNIQNFNNFYIENVRIRRSVQFTRRESIKIVPGGYISKRSINAEDEIIERCCPLQKCICNQCEIPVCKPNEIIVLNRTMIVGNEKPTPGNCCPEYECVENPDCSQYDDGYVWIQPCQTCRCIGNETFCHITCNEEIQTTCKSANSHPLKIYHNGEKWMEDSCTACKCVNGSRRCVATVCDSLACHNKVQLPDECCPQCDYNVTTHFCPGSEICDIVCQYDYVKTDEGCSVCKCMPATTTSTSSSSTTTSTPTPTISTSTATTTTTTTSATTISPLIDITETNDNNYNNNNLNNNNNNDNDINNNNNIKLIDQIHLENNENYFYYFSFSFILNLILLLIIIYLCYTIVTLKSHQKYDIIDSSLDSNLNEIVSTKFIRKY